MDSGCIANDLFSALTSMGLSAVCRKKNLGDRYVTHGSIQMLHKACGLDSDSMLQDVLEVLHHEA